MIGSFTLLTKENGVYHGDIVGGMYLSFTADEGQTPYDLFDAYEKKWRTNGLLPDRRGIDEKEAKAIALAKGNHFLSGDFVVLLDRDSKQLFTAYYKSDKENPFEEYQAYFDKHGCYFIRLEYRKAKKKKKKKS